MSGGRGAIRRVEEGGGCFNDEIEGVDERLLSLGPCGQMLLALPPEFLLRSSSCLFSGSFVLPLSVRIKQVFIHF